MDKFRVEKDSLGELEVPADVYWGINTQRALMNFKVSGQKLPNEFILALAQVKKACLIANVADKKVDKDIAGAIHAAIDEILNDGKYLDQFPIDIYQTGSGTQTNMNMNEVLSNRANEILGHPKGTKTPVHPNDTVNASQSSNDVIPTAMHVSALKMLHQSLLPAIDGLRESLDEKIKQFQGVVKVGRTHLQDAVPIPLSTEFDVYRKQLESDVVLSLHPAMEGLETIPLGGTALGTGLNAPKDFARRATAELSKLIGMDLKVNPVQAEGISSHSAIVRTSAALRTIALTCMKVANDIRWMASGPRAGLGELLLPENEPGSSIMPGKINPTQSEALIQVCLKVIGNDATISSAEGFGSILDLNVMKPLMIVNLLESIKILSLGIQSFVQHCLSGIQVNQKHIQQQLEQSLMLVTRLSPIIGYDKAAEIAKKAHAEGKTIREVIKEMGLEIDNLDELLDPKKMV